MTASIYRQHNQSPPRLRRVPSPPALLRPPPPSPTHHTHTQLRDSFFTDRHGRKVAVEAPSRRVAAAAISTLLFQLCHDLRRPTALAETHWSYYDPQARVEQSRATRRRRSCAVACGVQHTMCSAQRVPCRRRVSEPRQAVVVFDVATPPS